MLFSHHKNRMAVAFSQISSCSGLWFFQGYSCEEMSGVLWFRIRFLKLLHDALNKKFAELKTSLDQDLCV